MTDTPPPEPARAAQALAALEAGIQAARTLGLGTSGAEAVLAEATERLGLVPDAYVVALVGGTGVGKSSLLNALGGVEVSAAGARRPTTAAPVAWVAESIAGEVGPVLDRLGVTRTRTHRQSDLGSIVIVDMPDLDSLEASHRAIVEELLPKVDVVAWITDPEKYADAVLHDDFLRRWLPRLDRQVVVLNKADRLAPGGAGDVTTDLRRVLGKDVPVIAVTARDGATGVAPLRAWLGESVEAKEVVRARIEAAARAELATLAEAAGVATGGVRDLVTDRVRRRATDGAIADVARLLDMDTLEAQAVALTRARARRRGTGPLGWLTSTLYRYSGRERRVADPAAHLRGWRSRGGVARSAELVRGAIADAIPAVPPALRPVYAAASESREFERRLERALDRMVATESREALEPPTSRLWPVFGLLQSVNTVLLVVAVAWLVVWLLARPEVATFELPVFGPVPMPLFVTGLSVLAGYLLARGLSLHAGRFGRRWARRLEVGVRLGIREVIQGQAFSRLDSLEDARLRLASAAAQLASPPGR